MSIITACQYLVPLRFCVVAAKLPGPDPARVAIDDSANVDVPSSAGGVAVTYELLFGVPEQSEFEFSTWKFLVFVQLVNKQSTHNLTKRVCTGAWRATTAPT